MRPLTVITGILLGSSFSIAFSLAAVMCIFLIIGDDHPRLSHEIRPLFQSFAIFTAMTLISALSFLALLKGHAARLPAQLLMWACLLAIGNYYWP
jgi:hypothetical protein